MEAITQTAIRPVHTEHTGRSKDPHEHLLKYWKIYLLRMVFVDNGFSVLDQCKIMLTISRFRRGWD